MASIEEAVLRIVGDHLGIPGPALSLEDHIMHDLGADVIDQMELIMTVEEVLGLEIDVENIRYVERIQDIVDMLKPLLPQNKEIDL